MSGAEQRDLAEASPSRQTEVNFSWRSEGLAALLWALGGLESLEPLNEQVDLSELDLCRSMEHDPQSFVRTATLRDAEVLAEAESFLFEQHWRVRDAQLFQKPMPHELDAGIVYERRYALSWLVGWGDDWDDVPTDT